MLKVDAAIDRLTHALAAAKAAGADAADAVYVGDASTSVSVRLGALEDIGRSEGEEVGLRVFVGRRSASVSTSDLSIAAMTAVVDRAVAMAREAPEDEYAGLAPADRLMHDDPPALDLDDGGDPPAELLKSLAIEAEDAARSVAGVTNSEGGGGSAGRAVMALVTSTGFARGYRGTSYGVSASVIAGEGQAMQRDYAYHSVRHFADLDAAAVIGREAGERATRRVNPSKLNTQAITIVFDPRVGSSLLGHLVGSITGSSIARGTSFLRDSLGAEIFAPGVTIRDEPHRIRGLRSRPFDGEGLATTARSIIDAGRLTGWLMDSASARQLGLEPTGHAARGVSGPPGAGPSNLHMVAGTTSRADLLKGIKHGFYVTELIGMGVNGLTGDYSRGASGYLIEDGQLTVPVAEVTIAGNLKDMFRNLTPADDLVFRHATNVPTIRIDGMTLAGG
ncbi:TldD/PmbA family protein [Polymorphobacter sp. PAMC 29334]|uniref:TldD/PmbA family protein n=1 Tax=Polymorphobacter sp. PAMC 29334 TaxID=2862331 RepID=UPI001C78CB17|nr:TldD/PmbA family protein [Polymorphobacter sp. PAMC 29334]QYE35256.1 TldD/PmbA family protein [Polymorphobacter sp. PAMC 29334]